MKFKPGDVILVRPNMQSVAIHDDDWKTTILSVKPSTRSEPSGLIKYGVYESEAEGIPTILQRHHIDTIDKISELVESVSEEVLGLLILKHYGK